MAETDKQPLTHESAEDAHLAESMTKSVTLLRKLTAGSVWTSIHASELRRAHGLLFLTWKKAGLGVAVITGQGALFKLNGATEVPGELQGPGTGADATHSAGVHTDGNAAGIKLPTPEKQEGLGVGGGEVGRGGPGLTGGSWSAPLFVNLHGVSVGLTAGYETGESIIVLRTPEAVAGFANPQNQGVVDIDFAVASGKDRATGADVPTVLGGGQKAHQVTQYNIVSGVIVDASFSGAKFSVDTALNSKLYGDKDAAAILDGAEPPATARPLLEAIQEAVTHARGRR